MVIILVRLSFLIHLVEDNVLMADILFIYFILFSHLADTFIQSDLQMRTTEEIN